MAKKKKFAIIDIETTGGSARSNKITEIAILVTDGEQILAEFESLINPERSIPSEITRITGITNEMVASAPKFYEIAKQIVEITESCVFVAHNVLFDYSFIKEEFEQLGFTFTRQKLCTVQISRKSFPGLKSYSLGNLIQHFNIEVANRHRAMDDARATLELFNKAFLKKDENKQLTQYLNYRLQDYKLPGTISKSDFDKIPEACGVYYMLNEKKDPIYVGKSINIRERLTQHFRETTVKTSRMFHSVHHLDYVLTGNELMASLLESTEIKSLKPEINKAQRNTKYAAALVFYENNDHFHTFKAVRLDQYQNDGELLNSYVNLQSAQAQMQFVLSEYNLCTTVNQSAVLPKPCESVNYQNCYGACIGQEHYDDYNLRAMRAKTELSNVFSENVLYFDKGKTKDEVCVIAIMDGYCSYTGYIDKEYTSVSVYEIIDQLQPYAGNAETNHIIRRYLEKHPRLKKLLIN